MLLSRLPVMTQIKATRQYQCGAEATRFSPVTRKLEWALEHLPLDLDRSPEATERKE